MSGISGTSTITIKKNNEVKEVAIKDLFKLLEQDPDSISSYQALSESNFYNVTSFKRHDHALCASVAKKLECSYDCKILIKKDPHKYCEAKHLVGHAILKGDKKVIISKIENIGNRCTYELAVDSPNKSYSVNKGYEILSL